MFWMMGWRGIFVMLISAGATIACTDTSACLESFGFSTPVLGGAQNCVATFSSDAASISVSIGDMDAGCSATTLDREQFVACVSDQVPGALTCWRVCSSSPPDILVIRAVDQDATDRVRTALGDPPIDRPVSASVVCNGTVVSTNNASLESCGL